jgi:hypothetical protein
MKIIVIPDVHTHYEKAERIMQMYKKTHKFVLLGDYFDQFKDTPHDNELTAEWLKTSLKDENRVHLIGNHDFQYFPWVKICCSGFSLEKKEAINKVLSIEDFDKLKFFHFENRCWFSHAGLTRHWFVNPMEDKITKDHIERKLNEAVDKVKGEGSLDNCIWASDTFRGGKHRKGGILWNDWRNLDLITGIYQVVGHTPIFKITSITDNITNSRITNVDSSASGIYMSEVLEISETGELNIINSAYV